MGNPTSQKGNLFDLIFFRSKACIVLYCIGFCIHRYPRFSQKQMRSPPHQNTELEKRVANNEHLKFTRDCVEN